MADRNADMSLDLKSQRFVGSPKQDYSWKNNKSAVLHIWKQDDITSRDYKKDSENTRQWFRFGNEEKEGAWKKWQKIHMKVLQRFFIWWFPERGRDLRRMHRHGSQENIGVATQRWNEETENNKEGNGEADGNKPLSIGQATWSRKNRSFLRNHSAGGSGDGPWITDKPCVTLQTPNKCIFRYYPSNQAWTTLWWGVLSLARLMWISTSWPRRFKKLKRRSTL